MSVRLQTDLPLLDLYDGVKELFIVFIRHSWAVPGTAQPSGHEVTYGAVSQNPRAK